MPLETADGEVAGWPDEDLVRTVQNNLGVGADSDLPDEVRFQAGVTRLIRKRLATAGTPERRPALFLLFPTVPPAVAPETCESVPMLSNGLTPVEGRLWFVNPVVAAGLALPIEVWDDTAIFSFVTEELCLGDVPAVVFETRTRSPEARFFPTGVGHPNVCEEIRLSGSNVTLTEIFNRIQKVYEECLITPEAQGKAAKLWAEPRKHWASEEAEDRLQVYLRAGLAGAFPSCTYVTRRRDRRVDSILQLTRSIGTMRIASPDMRCSSSRFFGALGAADEVTRPNRSRIGCQRASIRQRVTERTQPRGWRRFAVSTCEPRSARRRASRTLRSVQRSWMSLFECGTCSQPRSCLGRTRRDRSCHAPSRTATRRH